jgi:phage-related minor tail protein
VHIANEDAQTVSNTVQNILSESASALTNGEETTDSIISKMLSNLSCRVSDRSVNKQIPIFGFRQSRSHLYLDKYNVMSLV